LYGFGVDTTDEFVELFKEGLAFVLNDDEELIL
jgi:hypothetical protein